MSSNRIITSGDKCNASRVLGVTIKSKTTGTIRSNMSQLQNLLSAPLFARDQILCRVFKTPLLMPYNLIPLCWLAYPIMVYCVSQLSQEFVIHVVMPAVVVIPPKNKTDLTGQSRAKTSLMLEL